MDVIGIVAYVTFAAVAACTVFNFYAALVARQRGHVTRLNVQLAVWCIATGLLGAAILLLSLAG